MWIATTEAEANFIFDLLADRTADAPVLDYARWLEDRGQLREAEFLRLDQNPRNDQERLQALRHELDSRWLETVTKRRFRVGDIVHILAGEYQGFDGRVVKVNPREARAGLFLHLFYRPMDWAWVEFEDLQLTTSAALSED